MRIAFFHNWSWLGSSLAASLIHAAKDELWIIGAPTPRAERDPDLLQLARRAGALAVSPTDVGAPRFLSRLRVFAPDLIVVGTFPRKLPAELLTIPKLAAINVHASLLPELRGALPEFWAIRRGAHEHGLSVHHMTAEFDAGRVIAQTRFPVSSDETLLSLSIKLAREGPPLLLSVLERFRQGERPEGEVQDESRATRAPAVRPEHLRVRFTEPGRELERLVRAAYPVFEPYAVLAPGGPLGGQRLVLRRVRARTTRDVWPLHPGELKVDHARRRLVVGTTDGGLELLTVEREAESLSGYELAVTHHLIGGERFEMD